MRGDKNHVAILELAGRLVCHMNSLIDTSADKDNGGSGVWRVLFLRRSYMEKKSRNIAEAAHSGGSQRCNVFSKLYPILYFFTCYNKGMGYRLEHAASCPMSTQFEIFRGGG